MGILSTRVVAVAVVLGGMGALAGCTSIQQAGDRGEPAATDEPAMAPDILPRDEGVRTIQLYRGEDERSLPVVGMGSGESLTLEFDLMEETGRPVSVYFEHADRNWNRDLSPSQALESFQDDRILEYRSSRGTKVPYVHYVYRFPNDDIRFRVSGNYILRVTERGRPDSVLFERPFFVTEGTGTLRLASRSFLVPSQRSPSIQPVAHYSPPSSLRGDPQGYTACFMRDGRLAQSRCEQQPLLVNQPDLSFELDRREAFAPTTANHVVDLGLLQLSTQIEQITRTTSPIQATLAPDYMRFPDQPPLEPLNGQIVVRGAVRNRANPELSAEYVQTTFAFVPSQERSYRRELMLAGSFSGMRVERGTRMEWNASEGRYRGTVLLKQGQYQYFYSTTDAEFEDDVQRTLPPSASRYTAFVYYQDVRYNTDRLLQVGNFTP